MTPTAPQPTAAHLIAALLVFACLVGVLTACGTEDLVFPGDVPATPTSQNTATVTPDDN